MLKNKIDNQSLTNLYHFCHVVEQRKVARSFIDEPISKERIENLISIAALAPSWCNTQPWKVYCVQGDELEAIKEDLVSAAKDRNFEPEIPFVEGYPKDLESRKQENDKLIMQARKLKENDFKGIVNAVFDNWRFFGAPQAFFITLRKETLPYGLVDLGCFLQTLLLAITADNLAACPQASLVQAPHVVRKHIKINKNEVLVCGVSFGVEDTSAKVNKAKASRIPLSDFFQYMGC